MSQEMPTADEIKKWREKNADKLNTNVEVVVGPNGAISTKEKLPATEAQEAIKEAK